MCIVYSPFYNWLPSVLWTIGCSVNKSRCSSLERFPLEDHRKTEINLDDGCKMIVFVIVIIIEGLLSSAAIGDCCRSGCHQTYFKSILLQFFSDCHKTWLTWSMCQYAKGCGVDFQKFFFTMFTNFWNLIFGFSLAAAAAVKLSRPTGLCSIIL